MTEKQARATDIVPPEDMKWLRRFAEICEDSDAGGHDLPKTAVKGDDRENGKNRTLSVRPVRLRP